MKKRNILLIVSIAFILTGCTAQYNLEIDGNKFYENIETQIYDYQINEIKENGVGDVDNPFSVLLNNDQLALSNDDSKFYKKTIKESNGTKTINLSYKYSLEEFKNSNTLKTCFENYKFDTDGKYYDFEATGYFYCLYGESLDINIKTSNKVVSNNADEVKGNTYTWHISNDENINIKIKMEKTNKKVYQYMLISFGAIIIILILLVLIFLNKKNGKDKF